ncbi:MAG: hypothetical protein AAF411_09830 [Myxococcota bacterium]
MPAREEVTRCSVAPKELLEQCREPSGVHPTERSREPLPLPSVPTRRVFLHTDSIDPDIDALGYDPFDDQPTIIDERTELDRPVLLTVRKDRWLERLPESTRIALEEIAQPSASGRLVGAVCRPRIAV